MKKPDDIHLDAEALAGIEARLQAKRLDEGDFELLLKLLKLIVALKTLVATGRFNMLKILKQLFGLKTELKNGSARDKIGKNPKSGNTSPPKAGRNGRDDYPGAKKIKCQHETLKPGDLCPSCQKGKLSDVEPSVAYAWQGQPPLTLSIYLLQRLLCPICKDTFTAEAPAEAAAKTVDDSNDDMKTGRCDANARANAMVVTLRYEYGVPGYRLAKIQSRHGLALPEGTQWRMISQVKGAATYVYEELIREAAKAELVMNDDTRMPVLDVIKALKKQAEARAAAKATETEKTKKRGKKAKGHQRKATRTTTVVAKTEGRTIVLYFSGVGNAGENLARILDERPEGMAPPLHMCDGHRDNTPGDHETIALNCLTHGRRGFFTLFNAGKTELEFVVDLFGKIYAVDAQAKVQNLSPEERLLLHQKDSAAPVKALSDWMQAQIDEKKVEPNSNLGKHIAYCQKRWDKMTEFLRIAGAPLSNDENERSNKPLACYRKNSLFYKTENGAETGDIMQSLIQTCNHNGAGSLDYFTALQENRSKVMAAPQDWLPWNYTLQLTPK